MAEKIEWTDAEREAATPSVVFTASKSADDILDALAPHITGRVRQARAEAISAADDYALMAELTKRGVLTATLTESGEG